MSTTRILICSFAIAAAVIAYALICNWAQLSQLIGA